MAIKQIAEFPGYWVSDDGKIYSAKSGIWLRGVPLRDGHLKVTLRRAGRSYTKAVHRLVLETFVGACPAGQVACHFPDRNPANNALYNLRWDTDSANKKDAVLHGTAPGFQNRGKSRQRGEANSSARLKEQQVREIESRASTAKEAANKFNVSTRTINAIRQHRLWKHLWA